MSRGYLIDASCNNNDAIECVRVYVPACSSYMRAFFGQYTNLTNTWVWDATDEQRQAASQLFMRAYLMTLDELGTSCDCDEPEPSPPSPPQFTRNDEIQRLLDCIRQLEETIMCMLCCNDTTGSQQSSQLQLQQIYENLTQEELDWLKEVLCNVDTQPQTDYKCKAANWIVDEWLATNTELEAAVDLGGLVATIAESIIVAKKWVLKGQAVILLVLQFLVNSYTKALGQAYALSLAQNRQFLINAIYSADSPAASRAAFADAIKNLPMNPVVRAMHWVIGYTATNWDIVYADTGQIPAGYTGATNCTQNEPVAPTGYDLVELIPVPTYTQNTSGSVNNNELTVNWDNTPDGFNATCDIDFSNMPVDAVGYLFQSTGGTVGSTANYVSIRWDFTAAKTVNSRDIELLNLVGSSFDVRGRDNVETGLTSWVNDVPAAQQDTDAQVPTRFETQLHIQRAGSSTIIGSLVTRFYAVIPAP